MLVERGDTSRRAPRLALRAGLLAGLLAATPAPAAEDLLAEHVSEGCALRLEAHPEWRTARVRVAGGRCEAGAVAALLGDGLGAARERIESLAFGRTVDYGWLRIALRELTADDPGWDSTRGRPREAEVNAHVARLLEAGAALDPLRRVLAGHGYRLLGVAVEKVLVGSDGLAFDAQLWLRLGASPP